MNGNINNVKSRFLSGRQQPVVNHPEGLLKELSKQVGELFPNVLDTLEYNSKTPKGVLKQQVDDFIVHVDKAIKLIKNNLQSLQGVSAMFGVDSGLTHAQALLVTLLALLESGLKINVVDQSGSLKETKDSELFSKQINDIKNILQGSESRYFVKTQKELAKNAVTDHIRNNLQTEEKRNKFVEEYKKGFGTNNKLQKEFDEVINAAITTVRSSGEQLGSTKKRLTDATTNKLSSVSSQTTAHCKGIRQSTVINSDDSDDSSSEFSEVPISPKKANVGHDTASVQYIEETEKTSVLPANEVGPAKEIKVFNAMYSLHDVAGNGNCGVYALNGFLGGSSVGRHKIAEICDNVRLFRQHEFLKVDEPSDDNANATECFEGLKKCFESFDAFKKVFTEKLNVIGKLNGTTNDEVGSTVGLLNSTLDDGVTSWEAVPYNQNKFLRGVNRFLFSMEFDEHTTSVFNGRKINNTCVTGDNYKDYLTTDGNWLQYEEMEAVANFKGHSRIDDTSVEGATFYKYSGIDNLLYLKGTIDQTDVRSTHWQYCTLIKRDDQELSLESVVGQDSNLVPQRLDGQDNNSVAEKIVGSSLEQISTEGKVLSPEQDVLDTKNRDLQDDITITAESSINELTDELEKIKASTNESIKQEKELDGKVKELQAETNEIKQGADQIKDNLSELIPGKE